MATLLRRTPLRPDVLSDAAAMVRALGHPVRLRIVECLEPGECTVSSLQERLDLPQAIVSQQLARMRAAGIVRCRREGVNKWYAIADGRVVRMLDCLRHCDVPAPRQRRAGTREG